VIARTLADVVDTDGYLDADAGQSVVAAALSVTPA
jgi:hypothetical protein